MVIILTVSFFSTSFSPQWYIPRCAVKNLFLAEILTNIHRFVTVVTNYAGNDMYSFKDVCRPYPGSFFLRQIIASVDFAYGSTLLTSLKDIRIIKSSIISGLIKHEIAPNGCSHRAQYLREAWSSFRKRERLHSSQKDNWHYDW